MSAFQTFEHFIGTFVATFFQSFCATLCVTRLHPFLVTFAETLNVPLTEAIVVALFPRFLNRVFAPGQGK